MCGIFGVFGAKGSASKLRRTYLSMSKIQQHRGPDATGIKHYQVGELHHFIIHERLSIVDPELGDQPVFSEDKSVCAIVNGEIYNYKELMESLRVTMIGHVDSQVVPHLYKKEGIEACANKLNGIFGLIIYDQEQDRFFVVRDHVGIIPVYLGRGKEGEIYVSSEMKTIADVAENIEILLPGHYYDSQINKQVMWYKPAYRDLDWLPTAKPDLKKIKSLLCQAVERRMMTDVPYGVLLSGGLDSSLTAAITAKLFKEQQEKALKDNDKYFVSKKLHSFCIGVEGSPDLAASRKVAEFIGTEHHEFVFTTEEGIDAIPEVIYAIETFNCTTIRSSTPMYLMARKIKSLGIKVVLTGEGSDEIFGGYLYFHKCPSPLEFQRETSRKVFDLYKFDLLRANKSLMAWGIEGRVPFLDKEFVEYNMSYDPSYKMINESTKGVEKYILRAAFDDKEDPLIPDEVLWRQKEQFSDGVGYDWIDNLKIHAEEIVTDAEFESKANRYPVSTPITKEAYFFREIFEKAFKTMTSVLTVPNNKSIACSTEAALEWDEKWKIKFDESGRSVAGVHAKSN